MIYKMGSKKNFYRIFSCNNIVFFRKILVFYNIFILHVLIFSAINVQLIPYKFVTHFSYISLIYNLCLF